MWGNVTTLDEGVMVPVGQMNIQFWDAYWDTLVPSECVCWLHHWDLKNIFIVDSDDLRKKRKSLGEVEIGILRGLISELNPVRIGLVDRSHTGQRRAEMTL
jgi:hypothetical protein